jgi:hypothetical protein
MPGTTLNLLDTQGQYVCLLIVQLQDLTQNVRENIEQVVDKAKIVVGFVDEAAKVFL